MGTVVCGSPVWRSRFTVYELPYLFNIVIKILFFYLSAVWFWASDDAAKKRKRAFALVIRELFWPCREICWTYRCCTRVCVSDIRFFVNRFVWFIFFQRWRVSGDPLAASTDFQMITWSKDQTLRMWPVDKELLTVRWHLIPHPTNSHFFSPRNLGGRT